MPGLLYLSSVALSEGGLPGHKNSKTNFVATCPAVALGEGGSEGRENP